MLTGVDDEVIMGGQNILLTFKNIGQEIFPEVTQAALDMTATMNDGKITTEGLRATAVQLGKALQSSLDGLSSLRRVGVTFTEQQKEQIKTLVKSGKAVEAQRIILAELKSEFGGAAEASKTASKRF